MSALREIGWRYWDPIGLSSDGVYPAECADEYDSYLKAAAEMLCTQASLTDVERYLADIASSHMGLSHVDRIAVKTTANAIAEYVSSLADGPQNRTPQH